MHGQAPDFSRIVLTAIVEAARTVFTNPMGRLLITVVLLVFALKGLFHFLERQRLATAGMDEVDRMSGRDFEKFVEVLFQRLGYSVERTQYIGDWGADLVLVKDGVRTVVQAKRWKRKVGVKAVQEVVAAKGTYRCSEALVVTNSAYTPAAVKLACDNGVRLWDREDLIKARLEMRREAPPVVPAPAPLPGATSGPSSGQKALPEAVCAICGKPVSDKVRQYCADHPERFCNRIYCFDHQRQVGEGSRQ